MSKSTISASATGLPESPCRVAQLQQDAAIVINAYGLNDRKEVAEGADKKSVILDMRMRVLSEKLDGIEKAATVFPATSPKGALFQLSLIHSLVDLIESWVPDNSKHADASTDARQAVDRMCYSIRDFIVSMTGANPEDGCGDYYMSERYNPHHLIKDAIAETDAADG